MLTWILLIVLGLEHPTTTFINGFTSQQECLTAAAKAQNDLKGNGWGSLSVRSTCLQQTQSIKPLKPEKE
jgi:hypothetical protein